MKAFLLLSDSAQVAEGKMYLLGGGWSWIVVGAPFSLAFKIDVPWSEATMKHAFRVELVDEDGQPFLAPTPDGSEEPLALDGEFCTGIPPNVKRGTPVSFMGAMGVGPGLPLEPNQRYQFKLSVDGSEHEDWTVGFDVVAAPPGAQAQAG